MLESISEASLTIQSEFGYERLLVEITSSSLMVTQSLLSIAVLSNKSSISLILAMFCKFVCPSTGEVLRKEKILSKISSTLDSLWTSQWNAYQRRLLKGDLTRSIELSIRSLSNLNIEELKRRSWKTSRSLHLFVIKAFLMSS